MGNPQSKPCYFRSGSAPPVNAVGTKQPKLCQDGGFNCHWWVKRGSLIVDPTEDDFGVPELALSPERLYFPYDAATTDVAYDMMFRHVFPYDSPQQIE